jgi:hypothetical protein
MKKFEGNRMDVPEKFVAILPTTVNLNIEQSIQYRRWLNLVHLGDEECNELKDGKFVSKYPEKETREYLDASKGAYVSFPVFVKAEFDANGNVTFAISDADEWCTPPKMQLTCREIE